MSDVVTSDVTLTSLMTSRLSWWRHKWLGDKPRPRDEVDDVTGEVVTSRNESYEPRMDFFLFCCENLENSENGNCRQSENPTPNLLFWGEARSGLNCRVSEMRWEHWILNIIIIIKFWIYFEFWFEWAWLWGFGALGNEALGFHTFQANHET